MECVLLPELQRLVKEVFLNIVKKFRDAFFKIFPNNIDLLSGVPANYFDLSGRIFLLSELQAKRYALLEMEEKPVARAKMLLSVDPDKASAKDLVQRRLEFFGLGYYDLVEFCRICRDGYNDSLGRSYPRRQNKTVVVRVGHDQCADKAHRYSPAGRMCKVHLSVFILELYVECLREILAQIMARTRLKRFFVAHHGLTCVCVVRTREPFTLSLLSWYDRQCKLLHHYPSVDLEHEQGLVYRFFFCRMSGMAFLPEEFGGPEEKPGPLLPAHYVAPLVDQYWQITPGLDPFAVHMSYYCFRSRPYYQRFFKLFSPCMSNDRALGSKAFHMFRFFFQE